MPKNPVPKRILYEDRLIDASSLVYLEYSFYLSFILFGFISISTSRSPQEVADVFVKAMSDDLGINFASVYPNNDLKGEIEMFISRKGHITDWHFDFMENFT